MTLYTETVIGTMAMYAALATNPVMNRVQVVPGDAQRPHRI